MFPATSSTSTDDRRTGESFLSVAGRLLSRADLSEVWPSQHPAAALSFFSRSIHRPQQHHAHNNSRSSRKQQYCRRCRRADTDIDVSLTTMIGFAAQQISRAVPRVATRLVFYFGICCVGLREGSGGGRLERERGGEDRRIFTLRLVPIGIE